MKLLFVQFANSMFPRFPSSDGYFDELYSVYKPFGYMRMQESFEVPKWIAEIMYTVPNADGELCYVYHSVQEAIDRIEKNSYDFVLFSVMTCTEAFTETIIKACPHQRFLIGGYTKKIYELAANYNNVHCTDTISELAHRYLGCPYRLGTDYSLFAGWTVLPRLTLSYGCVNNCKFCIVPHKTSTVADGSIFQQCHSFGLLDFKLVYIDDKTFGQASNYRKLKDCGEIIRAYNHQFNGFVIQTTCYELASKCDEFIELGVKVAEIGCESYNDSILKEWRKPSSEKLIDLAIDTAVRKKMKVIPNFIIGLPQETRKTYERTEKWILDNKDNLFCINLSIYTNYDDPNCIGEVDFLDDSNAELHREFWDRMNDAAKKCIDIRKIKPS